MDVVSWIAIMIIVVTIAVLSTRRFSPTVVLIISNMVVAATIMIGSYDSFDMIIKFELGFKTILFHEGKELWTLITSLFVHGDLWHLMFNMIFLLAIGIPLESRIGRGRFVIIYFIGGIVGNITFAIAEWNAMPVFLIGSSGAISALLGAMIMLYPKEKILFFFGPILTNRFPVWAPILVWFAIQLIMMPFDTPVAYSAHLGGFAAGAGIAWMIRPKDAYIREERIVLNISPLEALCTSSSLKEMYDYAVNARENETAMMWVESILKGIRCPSCGSQIIIKGKGFECVNGHKIS
ncbi:MAG: rhomboid family intramembrane serine protease [Methanomassiliicoccaceae archaeon]|nr:rhomboid family intramembrane serine protease [Methanomassiliicoccaceae archaeon]